MDTKATLRSLSNFSNRISYVAHDSYACWKPSFIYALIFTFLTSFLEAIVYLFLYFLMVDLTSTPLNSDIDMFGLYEKLISTELRLLAVVSILFTILQSRAFVIRKLLDISLSTSNHVGSKSLLKIFDLKNARHQDDDDANEFKEALGVATTSLPFACGFASRGACEICFSAIRVSVLLAFLFYQSTLVATLLVVFGFLFTLMITASTELIQKFTEMKSQGRDASRAEIREVYHELCKSSSSKRTFKNKATSVFEEGAIGKQLRLKIDQKKEKQLGSLITSYIYPLVLLCVCSILILFDDSAIPDVNQIALYLLITRQVVVSASKIGSVFLAIGKHQISLQDYILLMEQDQLPTAQEVEFENE